MLHKRSIKEKLLKGGAWVFAGKLVTGIAQILIAMVLVRMLSPEDYGSFQVLQRVLIFLAIIGSFGMSWVIVRRVAEGLAKERPEKSAAYAKSILLLVCSVSTFLSILFYIFGSSIIDNLFSFDISNIMLVLMALLLVISLQQVIPEGFRGLHNLKLASVFSGVATNTAFLILLLFVWLLNKGVNLDVVMYAYLLSSLAVITTSGSLFLRSIKKISNSNSVVKKEGILKENIMAGVPLTLTGLLSFFITQSDVWIVAALFSIEDAAYYGAASRLVFFISAPVMVANGATRGMIADLWARGDKLKLQKLLRTVASLTVLAASIPAFIFIFFSVPILGWLYGTFYEQAGGVLVVLVLGQLALLVAGPSGTLMILSGHQKQVLYFDMISAVTFFITAYILGGIFGPVGIAMASTIALTVKVILNTYYVKAYLNITSYVGKLSVFKVMG